MKNIFLILFMIFAYQAQAQKQCVAVSVVGSDIVVSIQETVGVPFILGTSDIYINTGGLRYTKTGVGKLVSATSLLPTPTYSVDVIERSVGQLAISILDNNGSLTVSGTARDIIKIPITGSGSPIPGSRTDNIFSIEATNPIPKLCTPQALPLEWLSFKANVFTTQVGSKVALEWSTASEKDVKAFRVERSGDGKDFQQIGEEIAPQFKTGSHTYTASDEKPLSGVSYYRIRETDIDSKTSVTKILSVNIDKQKQTSKFTFYPNPIDKSTPLSILTDVQEEYIFRVIDMTGRTIYNAKLQGNSELKNLKLGASGTYLYEIVSGDQHISGKIFVAE